MKIVVIGGTGLIGSKLVERLTAHGHEAVPAAPQTGVNSLTGEGLDAAVAGADVLVDLSNSPSFADDDVMSFFTTSTGNLVKAASNAGVRHYVILSIVGTDALPDSGYLRAKVAQETLVRDSGLPYSIVRSTQFFEFTRAIADSFTRDGALHLPPVHYRPIASDDVVTALATVVQGAPIEGIEEIGGPDRLRFDEFLPAVLRHAGDERPLVVDEHARYFGTELADDSLVPGPGAWLGSIAYEDWADQQLG
ncbi:MAG: SDR family oxidoreductase [Nocardioidaceae bacterium]|nr:SDR family oxidoreductase [Nocardioidaceae bacterium]